MHNIGNYFSSYSLYNGDYDTDTQPIRIDEGPFAGTVFTYDTIKLDSESGLLTYAVSIIAYFHNNEQLFKLEDGIREDLHRNYLKPILVDIITSGSAEEEIVNEA